MISGQLVHPTLMPTLSSITMEIDGLTMYLTNILTQEDYGVQVAVIFGQAVRMEHFGITMELNGLRTLLW
jgi:hypothetical protein